VAGQFLWISKPAMRLPMLGGRNQSVTAEFRRVRRTRGHSVRGGEAIESFVLDAKSSPMPGESKRRNECDDF
jgi:hypothetical protein